MSDGMAFLTGAAFAGVAVLFMLKGGEGLGVANLPPSQPAPISPANPYNPYNPYGTNTPSPTPTAPGFAANDWEQQQLTVENLRTMLEQQRTETEQLKAQMQQQQSLIENLMGQTNGNAIPGRIEAAPPLTQTQQQENSLLSGLVWGLGGMAVTISGGVVVVGLLAALSRQQRPSPRTTYVMPNPYTALPYSTAPRRRTEVIPPHLEDRHTDYIEYER
ncbi:MULTISPECIES: hypothetical protein [unclassified Coleofasciculus]|uniref:hypothetical protein n=1 Tax=unclassified Coleofasciculus TaxID=2692782 RepID=UPI00187F6808|nr:MULTISPECIES: hypothetical protein [unclassified Coleofasciculus]MBE9126601.1 hypothetical protein [Coleofasciculus sp. LEGE 07081]MBE9149918.1 hypothetical protein [Coleofasciculus sp. LEGE 07092]